MSDTTSLAASLPFPAEPARDADRPAELDLDTVRHFAFARQRWTASAGTCVKGLLMIAAGGFLLLQVKATPNLAVQIAIVGTLLSVGGAAFLIQSVGDIFGYLKLDRESIRLRHRLSSFALAWNEIERWRVDENAAKIPELPSLQIWTAANKSPKVVPGGNLSKADHRRIREVFLALAPGRENV